MPQAALPHEIDVDNGIDISHFTPQVNASQSRPDISVGVKLKEIASREDWETLKPIIRSMYLDKNMTRQAVTKYIAEEYNFRLT